jgi:hypothetical protein
MGGWCSKNVFLVIGRHFEETEGCDRTEKKKHLYDQSQLDVWYVSCDHQKAEDYAKQQIQKIKKYNNHRILAIYLIRTKLNYDFPDGLINEEMIWTWNEATDQIVPKGLLLVTTADGPGVYVV